MPTISDPTSLSKEELLAEWAVREEELRLQFESLRTSQTQSQLLLQRYERIFAYAPFPMLVLDSRLLVKEANQAARNIMRDSLSASSTHLPRLLVEPSQLTLAQTMRKFADSDRSVSESLRLHFKDVGEFEVTLVSLDTQVPAESYAMMLDSTATQ